MADAILLEEIGKHRTSVEKFAAAAEGIREDAWSIPREPGKWSPAQETRHLELIYRTLILELRRGKGVTPETFPPQREVFRVKFLPRILQGGWFPRGGVSPESAAPDDAPREKDEQIKQMKKQAAEFENAILETAASDPERYLRHPYFGALSLLEAVKVFSEHALHHLKNIKAAEGD
jgi:hypothetical protein